MVCCFIECELESKVKGSTKGTKVSCGLIIKFASRPSDLAIALPRARPRLASF